jgi:hypothetical protein
MVRLGAIAISVAAVLPLAAIAHGAAGWILPGERVTASQSTSQSQCAEIAASEVKILPHGFLITTRDEFVPQDATLPSRDGRYWYCALGSWGHPLLVPPGTY